MFFTVFVVFVGLSVGCRVWFCVLVTSSCAQQVRCKCPHGTLYPGTSRGTAGPHSIALIYDPILYYIVFYVFIPNCTAVYRTTLQKTILCYCYTALYHTILYYTILYYAIICDRVLYYPIRYRMAVFSSKSLLFRSNRFLQVFFTGSRKAGSTTATSVGHGVGDEIRTASLDGVWRVLYELKCGN